MMAYARVLPGFVLLLVTLSSCDPSTTCRRMDHLIETARACGMDADTPISIGAEGAVYFDAKDGQGMTRVTHTGTCQTVSRQDALADINRGRILRAAPGKESRACVDSLTAIAQQLLTHAPPRTGDLVHARLACGKEVWGLVARIEPELRVFVCQKRTRSDEEGKARDLLECENRHAETVEPGSLLAVYRLSSVPMAEPPGKAMADKSH